MIQLYWVLASVIFFIIIGNLFNKKQSGDWRIRALLSLLWLSWADISALLGSNFTTTLIIGAVCGVIDAGVAYALWSAEQKKVDK